MYLPQALVLALVLVLEVRGEYHEIETKYGKIKGIVQTNELTGEEYYAYKGIPYAKALTEETKFRDSEPVEPWDGVLDATEFGSPCLCYDIMIQTTDGDINCLFMNVYVPKNPDNEPLTTMFFIHGGAFMFGNGEDMFYGPDYFLRERVILVTINYRLAVFGFLNTGTADAPGNQALKDQGRAIRAYIDGIADAVNADKSKLTIFGESAGAASVSFQLATPLNKGYIARGIQQSGSSTDTWAYNSHPEAVLEKTIKIFGLSSTEPADIAKELTAMNSEDIIDKFAEVFSSGNQLDGLIYIPTYESDIDGVEKFLPNHIHDILMNYEYNHDVPVLMGVNSDEGALFATEIIKYLDTLEDKSTDNFVDVMPVDAKNLFKDPYEFVASTFEYYTGVREAGGTEAQITKMLSDLLFFFNFWVWINSHNLNNHDVYAYFFHYRTQGGMIKEFLNIQESTCIHADEIAYMFYISLVENKYEDGTDEAKVSEYFTKMWTNWAKYGDPTPEGSGLLRWEKFNENQNLMAISTDLQMINQKDLENNFRERICRFIPLLNDKLETYFNKFNYC